MAAAGHSLPDDVEALKALVASTVRQAEVASERADKAEADLAQARAQAAATVP